MMISVKPFSKKNSYYALKNTLYDIHSDQNTAQDERKILTCCCLMNGLRRTGLGDILHVLLLSRFQPGHHTLRSGPSDTQRRLGISPRRQRRLRRPPQRAGLLPIPQLPRQRRVLSTQRHIHAPARRHHDRLARGQHPRGNLTSQRHDRHGHQVAGFAYQIDDVLVRGGRDVFVVDFEEEVAFFEPGHVGHSARVYVVQVLKSRAFFGRGEFH